MFANKQAKTLTDKVYYELEDLIIFCKIEPGSILTEAQIAQMVNAGRTPVREALRSLSNAHLVQITRAGVIIPEISGRAQLQLLEIRHAVLSLCVSLVIDRLTELDVVSIQNLIDHMDKYDESNFLYWLRERNAVLAKSSKNQFMHDQIRNVQGLSHRYWYFCAKKEEHALAKQKHLDILRPILDKDRVAALKAVDDLIDTLVDFVKKNFI